jgi:hypothetical protein
LEFLTKRGADVAAYSTMEEAATAYSDAEVRAVCGCYQAEMGAAGVGGFQRLRLGGGNGGL